MTKIRRREWFDDDAFWRDLYPFMFTEERFAETPDQIEKILALTKPRGKTVLDLCCGPGRCSIALARKGFTVTGADRTRFLLDKARAKARAAKVKIEWVQMDMRDVIRPDSYDLVLSLYTSFGYFDDKSEDMTVLRNVLASLRPDGVFLIEVMGKERLAQVFQPTTSSVLPDGTMLVQRHEIFDDWTRIRNEWTVVRKGRAKTYQFHHTVYSGQELRDRLEQVGFINVELFGSLGGEAYDPGAKRLIAVGRKPGDARIRKGQARKAVRRT